MNTTDFLVQMEALDLIEAVAHDARLHTIIDIALSERHRLITEFYSTEGGEQFECTT